MQVKYNLNRESLIVLFMSSISKLQIHQKDGGLLITRIIIFQIIIKSIRTALTGFFELVKKA